MSVRVVATVLCERCNSKGSWWVPEIIDGKYVGARVRTCPDCNSTGTVEREVSCDGCWWFSRPLIEGGEGECQKLFVNTEQGFACKDWEPRG